MREGRLTRVRHGCCVGTFVSPAEVQMEGEGRTFQGQGPARAQAEAQRWVLGQVCQPGGWNTGNLQGSDGEEAGQGETRWGLSHIRFLLCHQAIIIYSRPYIR